MYILYNKCFVDAANTHTLKNEGTNLPVIHHLHTPTSVYCVIVSPSSPIHCRRPCKPLIRMIPQQFLHLIHHSTISAFSLIFNLGLLSHPELPACRSASSFFSFSAALAKNRSPNTAVASQPGLQLPHNTPLLFSYPKTSVN